MMDMANVFFEMDLTGLTVEEKIKKLSSFYESLPEPRTEARNSHLFVVKIGNLALQINDLDLAEKWGKIRMQYKGIHWLLGEPEFFLGKVYFAKGEMEKAKEYFVKVHKNSGWRLFRDENPEYRKLVEEK
ncbi:MAG: hypothetical protein K2J68_08425 [Treponemataceae bacterium]|nr:hypothetical protein [Treponemataceae bacterium]